MHMRWTRSLPALVGAAALTACSSGARSGAAGASTGALNAENTLAGDVRSLLSAYEQVPGRDSWLKLGSGTPAVLEQIATDPGELLSRRARACEVLGWFGESGVPFLQKTLNDSATPAAVRMGTVTGLARALPTNDAVPVLTKALDDKDAMVRFRTVLELKHIATPAAQAALKAHAPVETDGSVNRILKEALNPTHPTVPTLPGGDTPAATP
jgi:hypothetical protein